NFSYYRGMQLREKERFSEKDWFTMLRQELINGRPVLYRGSNPDGGAGHAFNIDGFHSECYFHFNWGWNGAGNGYFRLENMAAGGDNFTKGQAALFGIQPSNIPMQDRPASAQALQGDGFVELLWKGLVINDLSHYNIYRDDELIGSTWENHYRDTGLENGIQYVYHITASYIGENAGESVPTDDMEVTPWPRIELPYSQNLEDSPAGWELKQADDGFQWGTAADMQVPGNNGHLVTIRSDLAGPGKQVRDYFISPTLDIRGLPYVAISFDYVFKQNPGVDYLFLMYRRYDNGLWYPVAKLDSTGSWADWRTIYYYLPDGARNGIVQLGFYYNDFNGQGYGAAVDNIHIWQIDEPPLPAFSVSETEMCEANSLVFTSQSTGDINNWHWDFGDGAEPRYAFDVGPHNVTYSSPGSKTVSLVLNHLDHLDKTDLLYITAPPVAGFDVSTSGLLASFTDSSKNGTYYWWDFGDGNTSTEKDPENKYHDFNEFTVTQVVYNDICDPDTSKIILDLRINSAAETSDYFADLSLYPNPVNERLWIKWDNASTEDLSIDVFSLQGKLLLQKRYAVNPQAIDFQGLPAGVYLLKISGNRAIKHYRIVKK
ncbi:MAG: C10 family peptidase, partial [Bacteroidales bacterium]|nr:C10 family peptidase [Bacteroidales bacterium]